jgi:glutaredoxin
VVEILGSKYCRACSELKKRLDSKNIEYKFYDLFEGGEYGRYKELNTIAHDDGYNGHPVAFYNSICLGEGISVLHRIEKELRK